jgi:P27 family predicted phage terminase small subunit
VKAPTHLGRHGRKLWRDVLDDFALDAAGLVLLEMAARHWDRLHQAEARIRDDGPFVTDRFGQVKPHPAVNVSRDASIAVARCLRELGIDGADVGAVVDVRPPRIGPRAT